MSKYHYENPTNSNVRHKYYRSTQLWLNQFSKDNNRKNKKNEKPDFVFSLVTFCQVIYSKEMMLLCNIMYHISVAAVTKSYLIFYLLL